MFPNTIPDTLRVTITTPDIHKTWRQNSSPNLQVSITGTLLQALQRQIGYPDLSRKSKKPRFAVSFQADAIIIPGEYPDEHLAAYMIDVALSDPQDPMKTIHQAYQINERDEDFQRLREIGSMQKPGIFLFHKIGKPETT